jgi:hypothetical protein
MSEVIERAPVPLEEQMPMIHTAEALDTREVVDDLFEWSDQVTNSIFHAIHAKAINGVEWVKQESGIYRAPTAEEEADRKTAAAIAAAAEVKVDERQTGATPVEVPAQIGETMAPLGDLDAARERRAARVAAGGGAVIAGTAVRIVAR